MMALTRSHHQAIFQLLQGFNASYFSRHNILFDGGTRISLELDEYRESIDIDFLCANPSTYRAVRSQVHSSSLGELVHADSSIELAREVRADRDAVRTFINHPSVDGRPIKLEFVHFDYYDLVKDTGNLFPVPYIDRHSCMLTKLLANADRYSDNNKKDLFDLVMMHYHWGDIPEHIWQKADAKYGFNTVKEALLKAAKDIDNNTEKMLHNMQNYLAITPELSNKIIHHILPLFLHSLPEDIC